MLGFENHTFSVSITQLYCYKAKAATNNMETNSYGYVPIKHFLKNQMMDRIWPLDYTLLSLALEDWKEFGN